MYSMMGDPTSESAPRYAQFIVPQRHVKRVKTALEGKGLFDKKVGIGRCDGGREETEGCLAIPTLMAFPDDLQTEESSSFLEEICSTLALQDILPSLTLTSYTPASSTPSLNPLTAALLKALNTLPPELLSSLDLSIPTLQASFPPSYNIYAPMLLLPPNALASTPWKVLSSALVEKKRNESFWGDVAAAIGVSHVALNAGIPSGTTAQCENILRSPTNLLPLYGDFGTKDGREGEGNPDFTTPLWVSTTQNGIFQTWAPTHTMFSRGNVKEKARILHLPSVAQAVRDGKEEGCTAIDLYAGIGYFSFSYKKAGVKKVLGWEINPYSIEGLRRGARGNGWSASVVHTPTVSEPSKQELDADFLVFPEGNENAVASLTSLRQRTSIPPVRHVNLGFLPTTRKAWGTAVEVLDRGLGGWIHVHENVGVGEVEERGSEVVEWMRGFMRGKGWRGEVRGGDVERVKMYAPGVVHVVFDVWVGGEEESKEVEVVG